MGLLHLGAVAVLTVLSASQAQSEPPPAAPSVRLIYRCEHGGVMTFSDQPCGAQAQTYEADTSRVSIYEGRPAARTESRPQPKKRAPSASRRGSIADDQAKHKADCAKLADASREVRDKMRSGYNAKEGERLKARQAKLAERARRERCR